MGADSDDAGSSYQLEILRRMDRATNYNRWLFERAEPYLGRRVLDVGAGIGTFTALAADGREVVALEPDARFAARLRARFAAHSGVKVVEAEAEAAGAAAGDRGFDSAVCFNVLEHIDDDAAVLGDFRDVLVPGGRLLLLVPAHPSLYGAVDEVVEHRRRYRRDGLRALLASCGFEIDDARYVNPLGAAGWFVSSRLLRRKLLPERSLLLYDRLVPLLRALDAVPLPFGLSVWSVARRP
jgi:SAM-dependent methyltransferase